MGVFTYPTENAMRNEMAHPKALECSTYMIRVFVHFVCAEADVIIIFFNPAFLFPILHGNKGRHRSLIVWTLSFLSTV